MQVYLGPDRKPRISLDVNLDGPILLIPKHAFSPELMVGDIGHVRVTNTTRLAGYIHCTVDAYLLYVVECYAVLASGGVHMQN